jgi:hypothetical protein
MRRHVRTGSRRPAAPAHLTTQCSDSRPGVTCALFILFSWNYDLFLTSLQTYRAAGWARRIIVVDNSEGHRLLHDPQVRQHRLQNLSPAPPHPSIIV